MLSEGSSPLKPKPGLNVPPARFASRLCCAPLFF